MISKFTLKQFKDALPVNQDGTPRCKHVGLEQGEHTFLIPVKPHVFIKVRSSIDVTGVSADTGKDSIRIYLVNDEGKPIAKKLDAWTNRTLGWQTRMLSKIHTLEQHGRSLEERRKCPKCQKGYLVKRSGRYGDFFGCTSYPRCKHTENIAKKPEPAPQKDSFADIMALTEKKPEPKLVTITPVKAHPPNPQQKAYIEAPINHNYVITAGAGSGKTFSTIERIGFLVDQGVDPSQIVYTVFNKRMAQEGYARLVARFPKLMDTALKDQVCTVHALCYRILQADGDTRQLAKASDQKRIIETIINGDFKTKQVGIFQHHKMPPGKKDALGLIGQLKRLGKTEKDAAAFLTTQGMRVNDAQLFALAYGRFNTELRSRNLITYADMIYDVEQKLLHSPTFADRHRKTYILVDEAQDTSGQSLWILSQLATYLTLIGDVDQMMYRFRGARPEIMSDTIFEMRPDTTLLKLEINYRSTQRIVAAQLNLIRNNYTERGGPYSQSIFKAVQARPDAPIGAEISFLEHSTVDSEAVSVVNEIQLLLSKGEVPGDIAVLARTRAQLGYLEGVFYRAGVKMINLAGGSFWSSAHVADIVAYLRLAAKPTADAAFKRIFNIASSEMTYPWGEKEGQYCPHRFLGAAFLRDTEGSYTNIYKVADHRTHRHGVRDFRNFITELRYHVRQDLKTAVEYIIDKCYIPYVSANDGVSMMDASEDSKIDDLLTVADIASRYSNPADFFGFVDEMVAAAAKAKEGKLSDYVVASTIHRVKGAEFNTVFVLGVSENETPEKGKPSGLLPHTFSLRPPECDGILPCGKQGRIEDERCIFFVAVSRAKSRLYLSSIGSYRGQALFPSRFIDECNLQDVTNVT